MNANDMERYARQIMMPEIGLSGQEKLRKSRVLIIGAGGLGSPVALYLVAAGIGTIGMADGDCVELSNLQRQILYQEKMLHMKKVNAAKCALQKLNSSVQIEIYPFFVNGQNIESLLEKYDIIVDASDQIPNKFLINDACVLMHKPYVHGAIHGFQGQLMTYVPKKGACYRCLFEEIPNEDSHLLHTPIPVLGTIAGVIGALQATEVIKYLLGIDTLLTSKLLLLDGLHMQFRTITVPKNSQHCRVCGKQADIRDLSWYKLYAKE